MNIWKDFLRALDWVHDLDQVKRGERFLSEFQKLKVHTLLQTHRRLDQHEPLLFSSFLFYNNLLEEVLRLEKILGIGFSEMLLEIKNSVMIDIKFVRQKQELFRSTYFQMLAMSGLISFFIKSCENYLELSFSWTLYASIFFWQALGLVFFYYVGKIRERVYFQAFSPWFLLLYRTRLLLKSHLETAEFFENVTLELESMREWEKRGEFEFERLSFYSVLNNCRDQGLRGDQELVDLTQHLQDKRLFKLDKFQRELGFFKFFVLCFFFLLTYLAFVIYLFSFFMD